MLFSRLDTRFQKIFYSTGGDIDSLINISRLNNKNKNDIRRYHINYVDLPYLNHIKPNNYLLQQNKNKIRWVGTDYSKIYNFSNQPYLNHQIREKDIKEKNTSKPNSFFQLLGGKQQEWILEKHKLSQKYVNGNIPTVEEMMGEIQNLINKFNRLDCPINLKPDESTFLDVGIWAYFERRLSLSTIEKRLRYARFMSNHKVPVDFHNPSYQNFRKHMIYREQVEKASACALIHEWKTMRMFLQAYAIPLWPYKPPVEPKHKRRIIPYPDTVRKFFYYDFTDDKYENTLYQYLFFHSFMIGWRVPSEICEMKTTDVIIDDKGRGSITITETKKRRTKRTILPEDFILSSSSHKSMKNWINIWRPKVVNQYSGDALYLNSDGKPFSVRHLGHKLSKYGKKILPDFQPYDMRHWCAIARLIETKIETGDFDCFPVKNWLGHEESDTTDKYVHFADMYYKQYKKSWIHNALRSSKGERKA